MNLLKGDNLNREETFLRFAHTWGDHIHSLEIEDYEREMGRVCKVAIVPNVQCSNGSGLLIRRRDDWKIFDFLACGHVNLFDSISVNHVIDKACRATAEREFNEEVGGKTYGLARYVFDIMKRKLFENINFGPVLHHANTKNDDEELIQCLECHLDLNKLLFLPASRAINFCFPDFHLIRRSELKRAISDNSTHFSRRLQDYANSLLKAK